MQKEKRFSEIHDELRKRWRTEWLDNSSLAPLANAFNSVLTSVNELTAKSDEMRAAGKFSASGLADEVREIAKKETVPTLKRAADSIAKAHLILNQRRANLSLPKTDPSNLAEAVLRSEMRTWLRSLPDTRAMQMLCGDGVDERLLLAALEAPPAMSGLTSKMRETLEANLIERKHGASLAQLSDDEEAIQVAGAALKISLYHVRKEVEFKQPGAFDKWMAAITVELDQPAPQDSVQIRPAPKLNMDFIDKAFDEAFARGFPTVYPDHPVNRPA